MVNDSADEFKGRFIPPPREMGLPMGDALPEQGCSDNHRKSKKGVPQ